MFEWATDAWFAEAVRSSQSRLPVTPGADLVTQHIITDTPRGTVRYVEVKRDGRLYSIRLGDDLAAQVTVIMSYEDYQRIFNELTTSDRIPTVKVEGQTELIDAFIPARRSAAFREHTAHMRAITSWPS